MPIMTCYAYLILGRPASTARGLHIVVVAVLRSGFFMSRSPGRRKRSRQEKQQCEPC